ncbi:prohibitin family protein [Phaeocystidibacter luteus]|uniref:Prohibitin family protein n=1 Tax=Phaeocystidibacter luteus TaxID=911197 RepID=A0A6N6RJN2_9FLAO|nr:prohibitin family protein [Phaeocystidibacter luteus]KAB2813963.1 prohibitin family protein [Phaeocystidibacter luteus]
MKNLRLLPVILLLGIMLQSCAVVRPGEAAVKQTLGKLDNRVYVEQPVWYFPFTTRVIKTSIQTNNLELSLNIPSKEGLSINSTISILYRIDSENVPQVIRTLGLEYESIVANVFRSASADVCAQYFAKDMHSGMRSEIEQQIKERMNATLYEQGLIIEAVLMKNIQLPPGLASSIERKLQAEQDAMRMEFVLQEERQEAKRKIIEAEGTRDAQQILSEGLTPQILELRRIEAFLELSNSNNAKVIITDDESSVLISD